MSDQLSVSVVEDEDSDDFGLVYLRGPDDDVIKILSASEADALSTYLSSGAAFARVLLNK